MKRKTKNLIIALFGVFVIFFLIWLYFFEPFEVGWDYYLHAENLKTFLDNGKFPVPPGYPFLMWLLSGFQKNFVLFLNASKVLFVVFVLFKFIVVFGYLRETYTPSLASNLSRLHFLVLLVLAGLFMLLGPIYIFNGFFYAGRIAVSIWHNPTTMAVAPFAILLFGITPAFLENPRKKFWPVLVLGLINLIIKPSFLFAYIPGVFLFAIFHSKYRKNWLSVFLPLFLIGFFILLQYYLIYHIGSIDKLIYGESSKGLLFVPMKVWSMFLQRGQISLFTSLLTSLALPILFFILYGKSGKVNIFTWLAVFIFLAGLPFPVFLAEGGARFAHGNFFWTLYLTNLILFLAVTSNIINIQFKLPRPDWKGVLLLLFFLLHSFSGFAHLIHMLLTKDYF